MLLVLICVDLLTNIEQQNMRRKMEEQIWGTKRVCLLDLGFGYMMTLPELKKKGVFGTTVFKQKEVGWSKGSDAEKFLCYMQGKEVGYQAVF